MPQSNLCVKKLMTDFITNKPSGFVEGEVLSVRGFLYEMPGYLELFKVKNLKSIDL